MILNFAKFSEQNVTKYQSSMERLWLAFVMEKKFKKVWNGEEWIDCAV
jgi:hypothetical protein